MLSELLSGRLERDAATPLSRQIYGALRELIHDGTLKARQRLPSSRAMAAGLDVGRNTVIDAYAQLTAEGYLEGRVGAGSYISTSWVEAFEGRSARSRVAGGRTIPPVLSRRAEAVLGEPPMGDFGAFAPCAPDITQFPFETWQRLVGKAWRCAHSRDVHYVAPGGHPALRQAIASHLGLARLVRCTASQVIVTSGSQQGLDLCARLLADAGDRVWVEDPGYPGARRAFRAANLEMVPVGIDAEGIAPTPAQWKRPPRLLYITPSHQFPTGVVMSLERRRRLLEQAARHQGWILEDDYDGEFRYTGRPIAALQGIDASGRVVYVGTFSKAMFPGLRLGYLVVPETLAERFALAAARLSFEGRHVEQGALAAFISEGHFASHIRRMRALYGARRELLSEVWGRELGDAAPLSGAETGLHVVAQLPRGLDQRAALAAQRQGIIAQSLHEFFLGRPTRSGLVLGYGTVHEKEIRRQGVRLARLVATFIGNSKR